MLRTLRSVASQVGRLWLKKGYHHLAHQIKEQRRVAQHQKAIEELAELRRLQSAVTTENVQAKLNERFGSGME